MSGLTLLWAHLNRVIRRRELDVLPVLRRNGYPIAHSSVPARIPERELLELLR
ncbi:MAG TPA: hypothetical protein VFQ77_02985 [Pseudonocardiaceae bacterium]|jgi:hypothetical protein|nr:hypothetical protein [Pseudonocardiaceae bacterium]